MAKVSGPRQNFIMNFARYRYREIQSLLVIGFFLLTSAKCTQTITTKGQCFTRIFRVVAHPLT